MPSRSAKVVSIGSLELRFLVDETDGNGDLVMFEFSVPPEAKVPAPHYHVAVDEAVYGLAGKLTSTVDGVDHDIGPGEWLFIPRGAVHYHRNQHHETAKALIVLTPGSIGRRYFEEMADALAGPGRPDPEQMKSIMVRHGLVPA